MNSAAAALLASKDKLTLHDLAREWSAELDVAPQAIEAGFLEAEVAGEFEDLALGHGLLISDPVSRLTGPMKPGHLKDALRKSEGALGQPTFLDFVREQRLLAAHKDAVMRFAETRGLKPPSWWKPNSPSTATLARPVAEAALLSFLEEEAARVLAETGSKLTEKDLHARAKRHFLPKAVPRKLFRGAYKKMDWRNKRVRGEK